MNETGYLKIILGPMFSGKTTTLLNIYNSNDTIKEKCLVINHLSDDRYSKDSILISHDGDSIPCFNFKELREVYNIEDAFSKYKWVLINEGQFFPDIVRMVTIFVERYKMNVYIAAIDGDYMKKKIGDVLDLIPICDKIEKLSAKCECGNYAIFSKRTTDEKQQILVGDSDKYIATCRKCHNY